jgi:hypothetical protein
MSTDASWAAHCCGSSEFATWGCTLPIQIWITQISDQWSLKYKPRQNCDPQQTSTTHTRLEASTTNSHLRKNLSPKAVTLSHTTPAPKANSSYKQAFLPYFHAHCHIWKITTPRKTTTYILELFALIEIYYTPNTHLVNLTCTPPMHLHYN